MLTDLDKLNRACGEFRRGLPIVLHLTKDQIAVIVAIETLQTHIYSFLQTLPSPYYAVLTARRCQALNTACYDGDLGRIILHEQTPLSTLKALADPAQDLNRAPLTPLSMQREGDATAERIALRLTMRSGLLPAALVIHLTAKDVQKNLSELVHLHKNQFDHPPSFNVKPFAQAALPTEFSVQSRLYGFQPQDGGKSHYAIVMGDVNTQHPVLTRLHSECFTGDLLGSLKCDCGPQLRTALARLSCENGGVLLYLAQEGRGIGMANKLRAYALQDQGFDTVDANHRLGFEDDLRDFQIAASILKALNIQQINLMTNNPRKITAMQNAGIHVVNQIRHALAPTEQNKHYLDVKAKRSGHLL